MATISNQLAKSGKFGDLRKRVVFLLLALVVYRIGGHIPVPGIDRAAFEIFFKGQSGGLLGALLTFGEYKGYGMAVACELLGGALSGGGTWHREPEPAVRAVVNSMLTIVIDPARLGTQQSFEQEALAFTDWLQAGPVAPGFEKVQLAGDPERTARAQRQKHGISIDAQTWAELVAAGAKVGAHVAP